MNNGGIDLAFAYSSVRVKSMKSSMIKADVLRRMLDVPSIDELIVILQETQYKEAMVRESAGHSGIEIILRALNADSSGVFQRLMQVVPKDHYLQLNALLLFEELQSVKTIVAKKHFGDKVSLDELAIISRKDRRLFEGICAVDSEEKAVEALQAKPYYSALSKALKGDVQGENNLTGVFEALDKFYYQNLRRQLKSFDDSKLLKIVNAKIESEDILAALRLREKNSEGADRFIFQSNAVTKAVLSAQNFSAALEIAAKRLGVKKEVRTAVEFEIELDKKFAAKALAMLKSSTLNFGALLGFYYLKQQEQATIRKIAISKQYDLSEEIRGQVFAAAE